MANSGSGLVWFASGFVMMMVGILISATVIGAICGVPMIIAGIPMCLYGGFKQRRHSLEKLTESIRTGIVEGSRTPDNRPIVVSQVSVRMAPQAPAPSSSPAFCSSCGAEYQKDAAFCEQCGSRR